MQEKIIFGTHGVRGNFADALFSDDHLEALAGALELWIKQNNYPQSILIGYDPRESSPIIIQRLIQGFSTELSLFSTGVISTPALACTLKNDSSFGCGIMITASHNPASDNGLKFFKHRGGEFERSDELAIEEFAEECQELGCETRSEKHITTYAWFEKYLQHLQQFFTPHFLANLTIVLDCAHGSTSAYAEKIFSHFGARIIVINAAPDGKNINADAGTEHPAGLQKAVLAHQADIGFAFDGDGDRVVMVNRDGRLMDGDDLLAILATAQPDTYSHVIGTIMSNQGLAQYFTQKNIAFSRAQVGEKCVLEKMHQEDALLGGEPSGHILLPQHIAGSDGIFAALNICQSLLTLNDFSGRLFKHFPAVLHNIAYDASRITSDFLSTLGEQVAFEYPTSRIIIRKSGTQPLLRIFVESDTPEAAESIAQEISTKLM